MTRVKGFILVGDEPEGTRKMDRVIGNLFKGERFKREDIRISFDGSDWYTMDEIDAFFSWYHNHFSVCVVKEGQL